MLRVANAQLRYVILDDHFAGGAIRCVSYPSVNVFDPVAESITGTAAAPGETWSIRLDRHPRLGGGAIVSPAGRVVGVELATRDASPGQLRAATAKDIIRLLGSDAPSAAGNARATDATLQLTATHEK